MKGYQKATVSLSALTLCCAIFLFVWANETASLEGHRVVVCIPVYGQSLALGEEAVRVTDFDSLNHNSGGRIVTQDMNYRFGYFDNSREKEFVKRLLHYDKRSFELSVYGMAEAMTRQLGEDTLVCIFPGGKGTTALAQLGKGSEPYQKFLEDIEKAYTKATAKGWDFYIPAICWMQGESDITDYPGTDYRQQLLNFYEDVNRDIRHITRQHEDVRFICYQPNAVTRAYRFRDDSYDCLEAGTPETLMELIRDDNRFWASGPTYPYTFAREAIHIDGISQKRLGYLEARSALGIVRGGERFKGLTPADITVEGHDVLISFNVPVPPLMFDTMLVAAVRNYGFSVVGKDNRDRADSVRIEGTTVRISCSDSPTDCKVRYAINGESMKSGKDRGPRGNLRDSQGDAWTVDVDGDTYPQHNWCYQFDISIP